MPTVMDTGETQAQDLLRVLFQKKFESRLVRDTIIHDFVEEKVMPLNAGKQVAFHRMQNVAVDKTPISESYGSYAGEASGTLKKTPYVIDEVTATLAPYGNDMVFTDLLLKTSEPNPAPEAQDVFMYNGASTLDQLAADGMVGSTSTPPTADYGGSTPSVQEIWGDGSATLTEGTLDADQNHHRAASEALNRAYVQLRKEHVMFHPRTPGCYVGIITPTVAGDLRMDPTFQEIALKGTRFGEEKFQTASLGKIFGVELFESSNLPVVDGTIDSNDEVSRCPVFGAGYFGAVGLSGGIGKPRVNFIPNTPSVADPYGLTAVLAWLAYWAGVVKNPLSGVIWKVVSTVKTSTYA